MNYPRLTPFLIGIRQLGDRVAQFHAPISEASERLPSITALMIVKNEWETLEAVVDRIAPFVDEIVIGVDTTTDEPLSFAYREAVLRRGANACFDFFETKLVHEKRLATMSEISEFMGVSLEKLESRVSAFLKVGKPTLIAANRCVKKIGKGKVLEVDFSNSFSNARNQLAGHATSEFCMFVDGHEFLETSHNLKIELLKAENMLPGFVRCNLLVYMEDSSTKESLFQTRVWRNIDGWRFERDVHNILHVPGEDEGKNVQLSDGIRLVHRRPVWLQFYRNPQRTNMITEHMGDASDPDANLYYRAMTAHRGENLDEAIPLYRRYLEINGPNPESAMMAWYLGRIYEGYKEDYAEAELCYSEGLRRNGQAAFCLLGLARCAYKKFQGEQDEENKKRLLENAIGYCKLAASCEIVRCTIALPEESYTYEPHYLLAKMYDDAGDRGKSVQELKLCLEYDLEPNLKEEITSILARQQLVLCNEREEQVKSQREDGKRNLYIIDPERKAFDQVYSLADRSNWSINAAAVLNIDLFYLADVIWIEGVREETVQASLTYRGERKLVVRVHQEDLTSPYLRMVNWRNVHVVAVSENVSLLFAELTDNLPPVVIPALFQPPSEPRYPKAIKRICLFGDIEQGSGVWLLPEFLRMLPQGVVVKVVGKVVDPVLYESLWKRLYGSVSVEFCGEISSGELDQFMNGIDLCLSFSPINAYTMEMLFAEEKGIPTLQLDSVYDGNMIRSGKTLHGLAQRVKNESLKPIPVAQIRKQMEDGIHACLGS